MRKKRRRKIKRLNNGMVRRAAIVTMCIAALFVILIGRLVYFTVDKNKMYKRQVLAQQNYNNEILPYKRGDILDRNGNTLATSKKLYNLVLEPKNILGNKVYESDTVKALMKYMKVDKDDLEKFLAKNKDSYYEVYKEDLTYGQVSGLKDFMASKEGKYVEGIRFSEKYERQYPNNSMACQTIGFVSDKSGVGGLEQYYDSTLAGIDGRRYSYLDEALTQQSSVVDPENGKTIVSTIDSNIQRIAEKQIKRFQASYGSKGTSIIVMNPNNGEVYAMANSGTFNLNKPRDTKSLQTLYKYSKSSTTNMSDKQKAKAFSELWKNPIISSTFEPGSTYKPFTVAGGLEDGILKGNEYYYCDGQQTIGPDVIHCSHRSGHGSISLSQAISLSCNDALMQIVAKEGTKVFTKYQKDFNFGNYTEVDLPAEAATASLLHSASQMRAVDLATSSFGQSFNCSMIQMASAYCSLVNGGYYYKPHVVKQLRNSEGEVTSNVEPTLVKQTISKETSNTIKAYMKQTVDAGTGTKAQLADYTVGGKTGTAQKIPRSAGTYIVSFCGFAPVEKPQVVAYVVVDEIQKGGQTNTGLAVTMAKNVLKESLKDLNVPKSK